MPRNAQVDWEIGFRNQKWQVFVLVLKFMVLGSLRAYKIVSYVENDVLIYRQEVLGLEMVRKQRPHVMAFCLVFEAILTNLVSMLIACLIEWLNTLNMFIMSLWIECMQREKVRVSI